MMLDCNNNYLKYLFISLFTCTCNYCPIFHIIHFFFFFVYLLQLARMYNSFFEVEVIISTRPPHNFSIFLTYFHLRKIIVD